MAITVVTQPTADGNYSAYYPLEITATETGNPDYLYFILRNSDGSAIDNVPFYKAHNIDNLFTFDCSSILKALFDVRDNRGLSTTAIEELTNQYGKFEIVINTSDTVIGGTVSNEFFAFAMLENRKYLNQETANYGVNSKVLLYSNDYKGTNLAMPRKTIGEQDRVNIFVQSQYLYVDTYSVDIPNNSSIINNALRIDLNAYLNKLISIPLNFAFIQSDFDTIPSGGIIGKFNSFRLSLAGLPQKYVIYQPNLDCNLLEFVYINRYGVKENILFNSSESESVKIKSATFMAHGFSHTSNSLTFNTSANKQKINQEIENSITVKGEKILIKRKESIEDFLTSPIVWKVGDELTPVIISDGSYKITQDNRGLNVSFKYYNSQTKLSFK